MLKEKKGRFEMRAGSPIIIGLLIIVSVSFLLALAPDRASASKQPASVFKSAKGEAEFMAAYDAVLARWPIPYESISVPTRFGSTHVIVGGPEDGKPLVLLHAMATSSTVWVRNIAALSRAYRTYLVDIVGDANKSVYSRPLASRADSLEWLRDVLDGLHIEEANLGGISYGGWIALSFALGAPDRVKSLVLLSPAASLAKFRLSFFVHFLGPLLFPSRASVDSTFRWLSAKGEVVDEDLAGQMYLAVKSFRFPQGGTYPTVFSDEELKKVEQPTLLLLGDHEVIYNPYYALKRAKLLFPNLTAEIIPDAGHLLNMEQPEMVNQRILDFLDGVAPAGAR